MAPATQTITFEGIPPSVNHIYRNVAGKGRVKSNRYRTWFNAVSWDVKTQRPQKVSGDVAISIICRKPNDTVRRDIDNCIKAVLDMLVANQLIDDDSKVAKVSAEWTKGDNVHGTIVTYEAVQC